MYQIKKQVCLIRQYLYHTLFMILSWYAFAIVECSIYKLKLKNPFWCHEIAPMQFKLDKTVSVSDVRPLGVRWE